MQCKLQTTGHAKINFVSKAAESIAYVSISMKYHNSKAACFAADYWFHVALFTDLGFYK